MKILYLIDTQKNNFHKVLVEDFVNIVDGKVYDMSNEKELHEKYKDIKSENADVIISFDTAGFELRTGDDTLTLNALHNRQANILFQKVDSYGRDVKARQNLSMFMYISTKDNIEAVRTSCADVPNILYMTEINYRAESDKDRASNRENIAKWWEAFKKEAML